MAEYKLTDKYGDVFFAKILEGREIYIKAKAGYSSKISFGIMLR